MAVHDVDVDQVGGLDRAQFAFHVHEISSENRRRYPNFACLFTHGFAPEASVRLLVVLVALIALVARAGFAPDQAHREEAVRVVEMRE